MSEDKEKIACHICKTEIPKAAALHAEGTEYVHHFCNVECLDYWKKKNQDKDKEEEEKKE